MKPNRKIRKALINLKFNSLNKLKYLFELMNNEKNEKANEITSIHWSDVKTTLLISLIVKNLNNSIIKNIIPRIESKLGKTSNIILLKP